jgi:hypothetical protein
MSVPKKSLISNLQAVAKARIAREPANDNSEGNPLKANSLAAHSMKKKKTNAIPAFVAFKKKS